MILQSRHDDRIAKILKRGADIVVRAAWNAARWLAGDGNHLDLIALLKQSRGKGFIDRPIWIKGSAKKPIALRLVAIRKPKQARDLSIEKLKRHARDKGRNLRPETLIAAEWVILVTSLESASDKARGAEAGADAYIVKSSFDRRQLLDTIAALLGGRS